MLEKITKKYKYVELTEEREMRNLYRCLLCETQDMFFFVKNGAFRVREKHEAELTLKMFDKHSYFVTNVQLLLNLLQRNVA